MKQHVLAFLRPHPWTRLNPGQNARLCAAYGRFYSAASFIDRPSSDLDPNPSSSEVRLRMRELADAGMLEYPRYTKPHRYHSIRLIQARYDFLQPGESALDRHVAACGRIQRTRELGSKLVFLELAHDGAKIQALCNLNKMSQAGVTPFEFKKYLGLLRRGDSISVVGFSHRTERGELSVELKELPKLLSPALHQVPTELLDKQTRARSKHVDLLANPKMLQILYMRAYLLRRVRDFMHSINLKEVHTPILSGKAGGAVARSFGTTASEFPGRKIELRIAPELWLKRLILGGVDGLFEMGPCFRNEGIDLTHNPEFYMCELYKTCTSLEELISLTEKFFAFLTVDPENKPEYAPRLEALSRIFLQPFRRIDFITAIEEAINKPLPNLSSPDAADELLKIFQERDIPVPSPATLPRLLDRLATVYIEPRCKEPTFVMHHPECLSPLAKSFVDPETQQRVSARTELFVDGMELINAYEEENSPFEQRRKFVEQLKYKDEIKAVREEATDAGGSGSRDGDGKVREQDKKKEQALDAIDESYLEALEWGLPPTGGWGCGLDRLVMLFAGTNRINDVLSFGTLRNVVSQ